MIRWLAALLLMTGAAAAHPHGSVDQQAALVIAPEEVQLVALVLPGTEDGAAILAHLDTDADGAVSQAEAAAFGAELLSGARLEIDGAEVPLADPVVTVDAPEALASGNGVIRVEARVAGSGTVRLALTGGFGAGWFVQPYFEGGVSGEVRRDGETVEVVLAD